MPSQENLTSIFTDCANAIRFKDGTTEPIIPTNFADRINSLPKVITVASKDQLPNDVPVGTIAIVDPTVK